MNLKILTSSLNFILIALALISLGYILGCQSNQATPPYPQRIILNSGAGLQNIQGVTDVFLKAWNDGDALGCSTTYSEDAVFMPPGEKAIIGRTNIQQFFIDQRKATNGAEMNITEAVKEVIYFGEWAVMRGVGEISVTEKEGTEDKFTFKWAMLSKQNEEGKWESVWDIYNDDNL